MSNTSEGLVKKEKFTPEDCNPPETKMNQRPKHNEPKIKRSVKGSSKG